MPVQIDAVELGVNRCYLLRGEGAILVDAPKRLKKLLALLERVEVEPEQIQLVVITHGHFDHIEGAKAIKEATGAQLAIHAADKEWLEQGLTRMPGGVTGWGRALHGMLRALMLPFVKVPPVEVEITLSDEDFSLAPYGIPGRVIHTGGHSGGSVNVLLDDGNAFVGDMVMNRPPFCRKPSLPIFAEDPAAVRAGLRRLLELGAKTFYPGHGEPVSAAEISALIATNDATQEAS